MDHSNARGSETTATFFPWSADLYDIQQAPLAFMNNVAMVGPSNNNNVNTQSNWRRQTSSSNNNGKEGNTTSRNDTSERTALSKSLGAYPTLLLRPPLQRHASETVSRIVHAGYLLKRSNHPTTLRQTSSSQPAGDCFEMDRDEVNSSSLAIIPPGDLDHAESEGVFDVDWDDDDHNHLTQNHLPHPPLHLTEESPHGPPRPLHLNFVYPSPQAPLTVEIDRATEQALLQTIPSSNALVLEDAHVSTPQEALPCEQETLVSRSAATLQNVTADRMGKDERMRHFWKMAADFFGMEAPTQQTIEKQSSNTVITEGIGSVSNQGNASWEIDGSHHLHDPPAILHRQRSSPIKMPSPPSSSSQIVKQQNCNRLGSSGGASSNSSSSYHRAQSEVLHIQPLDWTDSQGHLWRSKYCILEDGILYFYRNQADAESSAAISERREDSPWSPKASLQSPSPTTETRHTVMPLSHSPVPRPRAMKSIGGNKPFYLWEKRVPIESVGAVRSAECEYGPNCFELLAPMGQSNNMNNNKDEGNDIYNPEDKLILRAHDAKDMGEWLFQFHRSIAIFVKNMIELCQHHNRAGDIHNNTIMPIPWGSIRTGAAMTASPASPSLSSSFSPSFVLSHGHGKTLSRRRRRQGDFANASRVMHSGNVFSGPMSLPLHQGLFTPPRRVHQTSVERESDHDSDEIGKEQESARKAANSVEERSNPPGVESQSKAPEVTVSQETKPQSTGEETDLISTLSPELSAPPSADPETERPVQPTKYIPPHLRNKQASGSQGSTQSKKYIPPHLRKKQPGHAPEKKYVPPHLRKAKNKAAPLSLSARLALEPERNSSGDVASVSNTTNDATLCPSTRTAVAISPPPASRDATTQTAPPGNLKLGGCADPTVMSGSILDGAFIPRSASRLSHGRRTDPFGYTYSASPDIEWDIGAVSECGIRESNEDSYLIVGDLLEQMDGGSKSIMNRFSKEHQPSLFCVFDGHLGNQAARYAAEKFTSFLKDEFIRQGDDVLHPEGLSLSETVETVLQRALEKMDNEFCSLCVEGGREWESGATALIAALVDEHLIVGNLGDARAVTSRSVATSEAAATLEQDGWARLPFDDYSGSSWCMWKVVSDTHSPGRSDERKRIEEANGWITYEQQIPVAQAHRLNLQDRDVFDILTRCFADRYHSSPKAAAPQRVVETFRVCGELSVSRALGDRDFKAAFQQPPNCTSLEWNCPLFLTFPDDHNRSFQGDLITNTPEFQAIRVGQEGVHDEFFLLACDGLWDVMDPDDAVRVTRDLLFDKNWAAKETAARLAELAVHLGSSDNVTVIVVRLLTKPARSQG